MASITSPNLSNAIRNDVPAINAILKALAKADPSIISDIENGTKRFYEGTSGWEFQELKNGTWTTHTKFNIDAQSVDGFNTSVDAVASTIVVRDSSGKLKGNLTGKADTAGTADKLASTLAVNAGGTGATTAADARTNLGVPPTSHKSTTTAYGVSSATEYGHSMAGSDTPKASTETGSVGVDVSHFSRQDHAHPVTKATGTVVGGVKLVDTYTGNEDASASIGITPKGVQVSVDDLHTATIEAAEQAAGASVGESGSIDVEAALEAFDIRISNLGEPKGGAGISVSGGTISLETYGNAGSGGPTGNVSPGSGGTFSVPQVTTDDYGRTQVVNRTVTMPPAISSISGNAGSATKLATARTITIPDAMLPGSGNATVSFNGSANVTFACQSCCSNCSGSCAGGCGGCGGCGGDN